VPESEGAAGRDAPWRRAAVASTLMAALELARRGVLTVDQPVPFGPIHLRRREGDAAAPAGPGEPADRPVAGRRKNRAND
jgi:chromatin segregation and condensation protein Rec8/ScpA/Scc1 (kleisin family)